MYTSLLKSRKTKPRKTHLQKPPHGPEERNLPSKSRVSRLQKPPPPKNQSRAPEKNAGPRVSLSRVVNGKGTGKL